MSTAVADPLCNSASSYKPAGTRWQSSSLQGVEAVTKVTETWDDVAGRWSVVSLDSVVADVLLLIKALVNESCYYPDLGYLLSEPLSTFWTGNEVEEENVLLGHTA
jgi:hypothetical protein